MYFLLNMGIFHCHVSLPEGSWMGLFLDPPNFCWDHHLPLQKWWDYEQTNKQNSPRYFYSRMGFHFATLSNNYVRSQIGSCLAGENIQTSCETTTSKRGFDMYFNVFQCWPQLKRYSTPQSVPWRFLREVLSRDQGIDFWDALPPSHSHKHNITFLGRNTKPLPTHLSNNCCH